MRTKSKSKRAEVGRWPARRGTDRVLLEDADAASAWAAQRLLERSGYDVAVCGGPDAVGVCPMVATGTCPLAEDADVIVTSLPLWDSDGAAVVAAHREHRGARPWIVEASGPQAARHADLVEGVMLLPFPPSREDFTATVEQALHPVP